MHNIEFIRTHPDEFDKAMKRRGLKPQSSDIFAIDKACRALQTKRDGLLAQRNQLSQDVGTIKKQGGDAEQIIAQVQKLKDEISEIETLWESEHQELKQILEILPNIPAADVPDGADESDNVEVRTYGEAKLPDFPAKPHFTLGEELGLLDFKRAARMSGARFAIKYGALAQLERALAHFMLATHTQEHGYLEVDAPVLVNEKTLYGSGHLPKFAEDLYQIADSDMWLIPTAETVLANYAADEIIDAENLPLRLTAWTQCFRSEAGAAGRDTRGLIRMHQFSKVEMVSITKAEESADELERMTKAAESILQQLDLSYRTIILCVGDMGFAATKTYDIEVWLSGAECYREISSCSNCLDFQARRMNARIRNRGEKGTKYPHMLNGSGLAVGRTLVAILENYQNQDGSITIPEILRPYMGMQETIKALS